MRRLLTSVVVDTNSDVVGHNGTSLRDAITLANNDSRAGVSDTITFAAGLNGNTITLSGEVLELGAGGAGSGTITIDGAGQITVSGNNASGVFLVDTGVTATLNGLTITAGTGVVDFYAGGYTGGGGIANAGTLTVSNSTVSGNSAEYGGGIDDYEGTLTVINSTISGNSATYIGGGISAESDNEYALYTLTVTGSTLSGNSAADGGAIDTGGPGQAVVSNSTVTNNTATTGAGGGVENDASNCEIDDTTVSGNTGTGVFSRYGALTVNGSVISGNTPPPGGEEYEDDGGGIFSVDENVTVVGCVISGNSASQYEEDSPYVAGGIFAGDGNLTVDSSTISNNTTTGSSGGGIYFSGPTFTLTVTNSAIVGNTADESGGGIDIDGQSASYTYTNATIMNSTISGNAANGQYGAGGGILNDGTLTVTNCTISGNTAGAIGGGIANYGALTLTNSTISANGAVTAGGIENTNTPAAVLINTIVAKNTASSAGPDIDGMLDGTSNHNLVGDGTGMTGITNGTNGNLVGTTASPIDPKLGPLQSNGGPTQTMALLAGSPAINAGGTVTTLTAAISASATSVAVANTAAVMNGPGSEVIQIDSEQMLVTSAGSGMFTVVRGYNGTTAAAHSAGAAVSLPYDEIGDARVGTIDIGAYEYHTLPAVGIGNVGQVNYVIGSGATLIASGAAASAGANGLAASKLTVAIGSAGGTDMVTINAGGGATINGSQLLYNGTVIGNFAAGSASTPLLVQFNGSATQTSVQAVLERVAFYNTNPSPSLYNRTATFTLTDSKGVASTPPVETIYLVDVPPVINSLPATVNYTPNSGQVLVATGATLTSGTLGLANSKLTVAIGSAGSAGVLTITNSYGVLVSGNTISFNGTAIGTVSGGSGSTPLVVSFNASATLAAVQQVIDDLAFNNTSSSPSIYDRTLTFTLADSKGVSSTATETVHFVDNPPTINVNSYTAYTSGSGATLIASGAGVYAGSLGFSDAKLTVQISNAGGADVLTVVAGNGVTISGSTLSYNGTAIATFSAGAGSSPLVVQFYASATQPAVQAVVDQVAFYNTNASPSIYDRSATFMLADSKGVSSSAYETIHFVDNPPTIGSLGATVNYAPGSGATTVAAGATVTTGTLGLANSKLTVGLGSNAGSADVVTIVAGGGITLSGSQVLYNGTVIGNFAAGSGSTPLVVQFNSAATAAAVQAVVEDIAYHNTNPSMSVYDRTISFTLADSKGVASSPVSKTIHVT
ncbi:MAG TPA: right-handed parallel beta-helix repeat-containing protein [Pirellulales bacterium]|nr:right-handed parallel beta-helix repeat-containing protein [Pirellulales bacterium]